MLANPAHPVSLGGDVAAAALIPAAYFGILPPIAAGLTIIWIGLQILTWVVNKGWKPRNDR